MKRKLLSCCMLSCFMIGFSPAPAEAQMFYNSGMGSGFDATGSSSYGGGTIKAASDEDTTNKQEEPYEKAVSKEIRERVRADAAYILGEPEEVLCYGVARKSPKKRSATIDGHAHTGNCGSLNETGLAEVQKRLMQAASYDMNVSKITSCVTTPRLALRFRKGFDFVDVILSGGNCPAVLFLYGGDTKEFSARPIKEWLDTFIEAVSNDLEPLNQEEMEKSAGMMFKKKTPEEESASQKKQQKPAAPVSWGRRPVPSAENTAQ